MLSFIFASAFLSILAFAFTPLDENTWCGKPYKPGFDPVDPGGQTPSPSYSEAALLDVAFQPRYSLYLDSEDVASFILEVSLSHYYGTTFTASTDTKSFDYVISVEGVSNGTLATGSISINSIGNEIAFDLSKLTVQTAPYIVRLALSASESDGQTFTANTKLSYLPAPSTGSVTKIDNLRGGLLIAAASDLVSWKPFFPYGWYGSGSILNDTSNADAYLAAGFNFINLVPDASKPTEPFTQPDFDNFLSRMDEIGLYLVYDMRGTYMNTTLLTNEVNLVKSHPSLLLWYTADEPDGWSYPLNSTTIAYDQIRSLDPYHPISLVLNCINYYYSPYSSGADIILEDAYPIGINATYSTVWNTPCTSQLGDCGCDGCNGTLLDVPSRIDILKSYQEYYNAPKPIWAVPQGFGNESYWTRYPTASEEIAMQQLAINHGAMGISSWLYPSTSELNQISGSYGNIITKDPVSSFLLFGNRTQSLPVIWEDNNNNNSSTPIIDATAWQLNANNTDTLLVAIVNPTTSTTNTSSQSQPNNITIILPPPLSSSSTPYTGNIQTIWGPNSTSHETWTLNTETNTLSLLSVDVDGGSSPPSLLEGLDCWLLVVS